MNDEGRRRVLVGGLATLTSVLSLPAAGFAQTSVAPLTVVVDPPTTRGLGLAWIVVGDDDGDATVSVRFRATGESAFRDAMPMLRVERGPIGAVSPGNLLAGSIFGLQPATVYEVALTLADPDGGGASEMATVTTRSEPGLTVTDAALFVAPGSGGGSGTMGDPFRGLDAAEAAAAPGDVMVLLAGTYPPHTFTRDGTAGSPITWRGASVGEVIFDGAAGRTPILDLDGRRHVVIERVTLRNGERALVANDSEGLVVRESRIEGIVRVSGDPVGIYVGGDARDAWICDNEVTGPEVRGMRVSDSYGIKVAGAGHVVCHNRVSLFWDGLGMAYDGLESVGAARSIDVYGNVFLDCTDDSVETDYALRNIRIWANLLAGSLKGVSAQPVFGGPIYIVRNEIYDTDSSPLKLHALATGVRPSGLVILHNSMAANGRAFSGGDWRNAIFRNNLFYGSSGYSMETFGALEDMDYDGWVPQQTPVLKLNDVRYDTINAACDDPARTSDFCAATGNERHAITFARTDWVNVPEPTGYAGPAPRPGDWDFTPREGAPFVDNAVPMPNVNDVFSGVGPDRGAIERGLPAPTYGPRTGGSPPPPPTDGGVGPRPDGGALPGGDGGALPVRDGGGSPTPDGASAPTPATGDAGGCGCHVVARPRTPSPRWLSGLAGLVLLATVARRRSTARSASADARRAVRQ